MNRTLLAGTAAAVTLLAASAPACAQPAGWTDAAGLGAGSANGGPTPGDGQASALLVRPEEWAGFAHVGYHLDPHWRVELQGGYRAGEASPAQADGLCAAPLAGVVCGPRERLMGAYAMVANLIFDALPDNRWFDPFFALGGGASRFDPGTIAAANPLIERLQTSAGGAQLAYQALVGLAFRPHDRLHFDLSYRWLGGGGSAPNGQAVAFNNRFYQDQTVSISVRYALSSPRAALAPAPSFGLASAAAPLAASAPAPHTVVVETPSNPAALAGEAQATVRQAALSASQGRGSRVVVDGHADTASAAAYNQRLSERRAKAMADAMVALGVPPSALDIRWDGDGPDSALASR
jgi:outer membrane protein OmpA-like peptidoglycan-associated protein